MHGSGKKGGVGAVLHGGRLFAERVTAAERQCSLFCQNVFIPLNPIGAGLAASKHVAVVRPLLNLHPDKWPAHGKYLHRTKIQKKTNPPILILFELCADGRSVSY